MYIAVTILAQLLFITFLILSLYRFHPRFGLGPLFLLIGTNQVFQTILSTSFRIELFGGLQISLGSSILFSASLFTILLIYIKEGVKTTQQLILAIIIANISTTILSLIVNQQEIAMHSFNSQLFKVNFRIFFVGTAVLILDAFLIVILYEFLFSRAKRLSLYSRLLIAMLVTLNFDAMMFSLGGFWDRPYLGSFLLSQVVGKTGTAIFFATMLFVYLRYFDTGFKSVGFDDAEGNEDIFSILTYKGRYEKLKTEKAISDEQLQKIISEKTTELEKSIRRFTVFSTARELRVDKFSMSDQVKELLQKAKEIFEVDACTIHLVKREELQMLANIGISENNMTYELPLTFPYIKKMIDNKESLKIDDTRLDPVFNIDLVKDSNCFKYISCAGAPLISGNKVTGVLKLYSVNSKRIFSKLEMEHIQIIAGQIAHAIETNQLFLQNEKHKEVLVKQIVARKKAEEKIKLSNERFELIGKAANDGLWEWNLDNGELWGNEAHQHLYGLTLADPVPVNDIWKNNLHEEDRKRIIDSLENALASDKNSWDGEYRMYTPNKGWINIYGRTYIERNEEGRAIRMLGSMLDITDRKQSEIKVLKEKNLSDSLINSLPGIFYLFDDSPRFLRWNKNFETLSGYTAEEISSIMPMDLFLDDEKLVMKKQIEKTRNEGFATAEVTLVNKKGRKISIFFTGVKINYEGKDCILGNGLDITERIRSEEEILEINNQLRLLSEHLQNIREEERASMAREIHDELGQQLTIMKMDVSWLQDSIKKEDEAIINRTKELKNMLDQTVNTVRKIAYELRPSLLDDMGLEAAIEWQLTEFEKRSGVKSVFDGIKSTLPLSDAAIIGLFRIVQESLTNIGRHAKAKHVKVSLVHNVEAGTVILKIVDDGLGFEIEKLAFKKSLGIVGMKERCIMLGGEFKIDSTFGSGTKIKITVPVHKEIEPV